MRLPSLLAATLFLIHGAAASAGGQAALDLPGGRLGNAIAALGRQTGTSIGMSDPQLAARPVPALRGRFTVGQALSHLLRGSGARYTPVDARTYRVSRVSMPARRSAPPASPRQDPDQAEDAEPIIVTATKRPVWLLHYPGSASVLDGDDPALRARGHGSEALASRLPGVSSTHLGSGRNKLFIRGIADSSFNGPTQSTVGQYLRDTRLNYNTPDPDLRLYDIDRVELLPGPQGTLYGAGSLGGILRVVPNGPQLDRLSGEAGVAAAITQHGDPGAEISGVLNIPLAYDRLGLRVVGYGISEGGYIDDPRRGLDDVNRTHVVGGRAMLRAATDTGWTFDITAAAQQIVGEDGQFADRDAPPLTRRSAVIEDYESDYLLADLVVSGSWGNTRLISSTGIVRQRLEERYDSTRPDQAPEVFDQRNEVTLLSSETRLSHSGRGGSGWLMGMSLIANDSTQHRAMGSPDAPVPSTGVANAVDEVTFFGEGTLGLLPGIAATAGGRVTHSRLSGSILDAPAIVVDRLDRVTARRSETAFLPSLALSAQASSKLTFFARYQEGFRPGGLAVSGPFVNRFESDDVAAFEAGMRYGLPGRGPIDLSASIAYTRWTDVQADLVDMAGFPSTANIGDGRIHTLDLKAGWRPIAGLSAEFSAVFNDSRLSDPRSGFGLLAASSLPNVADINARLAVGYEARISDDMRLELGGSVRYAGTSRLGIGPVLDQPQGDWVEVDLGARLQRDSHALTIDVSNLLDTVGNRFAMGSPFTLLYGRQITPLRPRTLRIGWETRF